MLKIKNVSAVIDTTQVLSDINLEIKKGEIHAILGPKCSGKSSLAHLIQGNPNVILNTGDILFKGKDIKKLKPERRSDIGIFTTFQNPPEIEGLSNLDLIRSLFKHRVGGVFTSDLETAYRTLVSAIGLSPHFPEESINSELHGPEDWKKSEIVQLLMLLPELLILDEIDTDLSDVSIDIITQMLKKYLDDNKKSVIIITHSKKFLDLMEPSHVHVLVDGEIRESGTAELYKRILEDGNTQFS